MDSKNGKISVTYLLRRNRTGIMLEEPAAIGVLNLSLSPSIVRRRMTMSTPFSTTRMAWMPGLEVTLTLILKPGLGWMVPLLITQNGLAVPVTQTEHHQRASYCTAEIDMSLGSGRMKLLLLKFLVMFVHTTFLKTVVKISVFFYFKCT